MSETAATTFSGEALPMYPSGSDEPAHVICEASFRENLDAALELFEADRAEFYINNPSNIHIIDVNARCIQSAKELVAVAESLVRDSAATSDDKIHALQVIRYVNNDAASRRETIRRAMNAALRENPRRQDLRLRWRKALLDSIHSAQCIANSLASYEKRVAAGDDFSHPIEKLEKKASVIAKRIRGAVPEGRSYRPAMIYPKRVSPPGEPVPGYPEAMNRFLETPVEEKEFDLEMNEFVLPEGYRSADGKLTDKSVIWHPETHEVELGLEGEEKEIWNYLKVTDDSEVFRPGEWSTDYQIRLFQQKFAGLNPEALQQMLG